MQTDAPPVETNAAAERPRALESYQIWGTPPEAAFDRIVGMVGKLFEVAEAHINFLDDCAQWSKAFYGGDASGLGLEHSFCARAILQDDLLIVLDATQDPRFYDNPLVTGGPKIRFYVGAVLKSGGVPIGTLCLVDPKPRAAFGRSERTLLQDFAALVMDELELRRNVQMLAQTKAELGRAYTALATEMAQLKEVTQALHEANDRLQHHAHHDVLTRLPNRARFLERLGYARTQDAPFALLFLDFDRFKLVNDTYGHATGDEVLTLLARRLLGALKKEDILARFGGDEFSVLLQHATQTGAAATAERLRAVFYRPLKLAERSLQLGVSIGMVVSEPPHRKTLEELLQNADHAMYRAKARGDEKGAVVFATPA